MGTKQAAASSASRSSIRVVANRTGIGPHTLRVWERRYGFPQPERRPGGAREYTEDDVAKLKLIARALDAGFRAGEAVPLAVDDLDRLLEATRLDTPRAATTLPPDEIVGDLLEALRADDVVTVQTTLRAAATALGAQRFVTEIAHPLAVRMGELWTKNELDIRQEHLGSACLTRELHAFTFDDDEVDGGRSPVVVLATLPGERHILPLEMVAVYVAASGAAPRMLGADTPPLEIAAAARAMKAHAVGVSVSSVADPARSAASIRELLAELPRRTEVWLGGAGARALAAGLPGPVLALDGFAAIDRKLEALRAR